MVAWTGNPQSRRKQASSAGLPMPANGHPSPGAPVCRAGENTPQECCVHRALTGHAVWDSIRVRAPPLRGPGHQGRPKWRAAPQLHRPRPAFKHESGQRVRSPTPAPVPGAGRHLRVVHSPRLVPKPPAGWPGRPDPEKHQYIDQPPTSGIQAADGHPRPAQPRATRARRPQAGCKQAQPQTLRSPVDRGGTGWPSAAST